VEERDDLRGVGKRGSNFGCRLTSRRIYLQKKTFLPPSSALIEGAGRGGLKNGENAFIDLGRRRTHGSAEVN